ncbi:unnamed protein product [Staurois parvus]|uniref:Uncharacterized protein n=1 Tax=Staurois parvus TaxID=386267 RepID=A0ABN9E2J7_9NEOB|nr:unnamed protein product [Staurois parvus]
MASLRVAASSLKAHTQQKPRIAEAPSECVYTKSNNTAFAQIKMLKIKAVSVHI